MLFSLLLTASITISIPSVQTRLINNISANIFSRIHHIVHLEYLNIRWFDTILIKDLRVYDTQNRLMIKADRVILDFKLTDLLTNNNINFDKAILQGAQVNMLKDAPSGQFNLNYFIEQIKTQIIKKKKRRKAKNFTTDNIVLTNGKFRMYRADKALITTRFDQYHFTISDLEANLTNFIVDGTDIAFKVKTLQCLDSATHLDIKDLKTNFLYTKQSMVFQNMELTTAHSSVTQSMVFNYKQPSSVKEFVDSVNITSNVKKAILYSGDLAKFAPSLRKYHDYYRLKGYLTGPVSRFNAKNITLQVGRRSEIKGYLSMYGLPNIQETFINAKISNSKLFMEDFSPYTSEETQERISKFGQVKLAGNFSGFPKDFVSKATFTTEIGKLQTDINLKIGQQGQDNTTYSGKLVTEDFNLGKFFEDTIHYQFLNMSGRVFGKGFSREKARFDLISTISRLGINGYTYQNIQTDAILAEQFFNGNLKINDPNLQFEGKLSIDLNQSAEVIKAQANLGKANLDTLKITNKPAFLSSSLNVDMRGLSLDEILGQMSLNKTYFEYNQRSVFVDHLKLSSEQDSLSRTLTIESPLANIHIFGDFNYSAFFKDIVDVYDEYKLIFRNNSEEIRSYYANHHKDYSDYYYLDYDIDLKDINQALNLFLPNFFLSRNTKMIGSFTGGATKLVELNSKFDTLTIDKYTFVNDDISFNTQKSSDTTLVYAQYHIKSDQQLINHQPRGQNMNCNVNWNGNKIDFIMNIAQYNTTNYAKAKGNITFLPDETQIKMSPSEFQIIDKIWRLNEQNSITLKRQAYTFRNLVLYHENQKISVNGNLSKNPDDNLFVSIVNFDMKNLDPLSKKNFDGIFNGFIDIKHFFEKKKIDSRLNIRNFKINKFLVGDVITTSEYNNNQHNFDVQLSVNRHKKQTMFVEGFIDPTQPKNQLNLEARFNHANLELLEPFFEDYISDVKGHLDGQATINGLFNKPVIKGEGNTDDGEFTLDYFKTHYGLAGKVNFDTDVMDFKQFKLTDSYGHTGHISGQIRHNGFRNLEYDFKGHMDDFLVLNTTNKDNSLYYGTAFATGDLRIFGKEKIFNISASATSQKGTKFYIPLEGSSEAVKEDFIHFLSVNDTAKFKAVNKSKKLNLSGINLNLDLDITPDAYCEIIFDLTAGDIIRGRGNGKLNLQIDTKGAFNMFGDYEITEGAYNFTLYNIINKEFSIEPNSKISWTGDPYKAILDIQASYDQLASLAPIMRVTSEDIRQNPGLNRKYPAKVLLDIQGNLTYPEINFDIDVDDYPKNATYNDNGVSVETSMTAFKNKIATDEQELKRQVFSLIILKSFSAENAFNVGGSVGRSVSEFISNQISYWITQIDENLVVDVDLGSMDQEAFNTFQLRMSYSFLNGRLRVTRDGGFTDQTSGANLASVLGDWSVEYLLSPDGKLRAKIYNKTNYNNLNPTLKTASTTAGFSLMHTQSFDQLKNIFKKSREKNRSPSATPPPGKIKPEEEEGISQRKDTTGDL